MGNQNQAAASGAPLSKADLTNTRKSVLLFFEFGADGQPVYGKTFLLVHLSPRLNQEVEKLLEGDEGELRAYLQSVAKTIPRKNNPSEISDFNYHYVDGELVNIDTGKPFHWVNQTHYDALGDTVTRHIQGLMMKDYGLEEVLLPLDPTYEGPKNNIFVSPNWQTADKLMLLIQGSGAVRPGQWARALCINNNLKIGTILPYLDRCKTEGYAVIVFNPNQNDGPLEPETIECTNFLTNGRVEKPAVKKARIPGSESPVKHVVYVWDNFVAKAQATTVSAVAHSAGGHGAQQLVEHREEECTKRLCGIAFTDSVHGGGGQVPHFIQKRCRNWVTSKHPLDTPVRKSRQDCLCVSAGHDTHEFTSGFAIESVFTFLLHRAEVFPTESPDDKNYDGMPPRDDRDD